MNLNFRKVDVERMFRNMVKGREPQEGEIAGVPEPRELSFGEQKTALAIQTGHARAITPAVVEDVKDAPKHVRRGAVAIPVAERMVTREVELKLIEEAGLRRRSASGFLASQQVLPADKIAKLISNPPRSRPRLVRM